jgi:hypothetical protein
MKRIMLIKMSINKVYDGVRVFLCDFFYQERLKSRRCFIAMLLNFALDYVIRKVQEYQKDFKLNRHTSPITLG